MNRKIAGETPSTQSISAPAAVLDPPNIPDQSELDRPELDQPKLFASAAETIPSHVPAGTGKAPAPFAVRRKSRAISSSTATKRYTAEHSDDIGANRQAELFYLQKQIQQQTQMVFVLEDGSQVQGVVEWYDRHSIKVRGKSRVLIYKSAIKYLYKAGETGPSPES